jgi:membrane protein DedA with SNARE-associated domain
VQHFIASYGYAAVFVLMLAESACIPIPSEVIMLFGGALAAGAVPGTHPALAGIIAAGVAGNVVGSYLAWAAGRHWGQAALRRWGRRVRLREHDIDRAAAWFDRYGPAAVFFGRLVPVVRTFISLPAGFAGMPAARFGIYTTAGCVPWTAGLAAAGYALGRNWQAVANGFHGPTYLIAAFLAVALAAAVVIHLRRRGAGPPATRQAAGVPARPDDSQPGPLADPGRDGPAAGRQQRALWQAVNAAEFAVLEARQAGAQTGELDALCRRLRLAVQDTDRSLPAARSGPASGRQPGSQPSAVGELLAAASLIQDAAASAAAPRPAGRSPAYDPRRQAEAIAARIASAEQAATGIPSADS